MPQEDNPLLPPQESSLFGKKWILWSLIGVLVVGVIGFLFFAFTFPFRDQVFSLLYQRFPGLAWKTAQSAQAVCSSIGTVEIQVSFTNTEPVNPVWCMNVTATDVQTGESVDLGPIESGQTATGVIETKISPLSAGQVRFDLTWCDGRSGVDRRTVSYGTVTCQAPSPTPTATPSPSATPTITPNPSETPSPTPVPSVTVTATPPPVVTPTTMLTPAITPTVTLGPTFTPSPTDGLTSTPTAIPTPAPIGVVVDPTFTPSPTEGPSPTPLVEALPDSGAGGASLAFLISTVLSLGTGGYLLKRRRANSIPNA